MWRQVDGGRPLRCEVCGEQIGKLFGEGDPDPDLVVLRCYGCAVMEEAVRATIRGAREDTEEASP